MITKGTVLLSTSFPPLPTHTHKKKKGGGQKPTKPKPNQTTRQQNQHFLQREYLAKLMRKRTLMEHGKDVRERRIEFEVEGKRLSTVPPVRTNWGEVGPTRRNTEVASVWLCHRCDVLLSYTWSSADEGL